MARDLRRRYGDRHRIVRAESGEQALAALREMTLREMTLRGDSVAVLLADYRMPQMSGLQFIEAAMDLFPGARRVLLTAYADTGAAIEAINVVDLEQVEIGDTGSGIADDIKTRIFEPFFTPKRSARGRA